MFARRTSATASTPPEGDHPKQHHPKGTTNRVSGHAATPPDTGEEERPADAQTQEPVDHRRSPRRRNEQAKARATTEPGPGTPLTTTDGRPPPASRTRAMFARRTSATASTPPEGAPPEAASPEGAPPTGSPGTPLPHQTQANHPDQTQAKTKAETPAGAQTQEPARPQTQPEKKKQEQELLGVAEGCCSSRIEQRDPPRQVAPGRTRPIRTGSAGVDRKASCRKDRQPRLPSFPSGGRPSHFRRLPAEVVLDES